MWLFAVLSEMPGLACDVLDGIALPQQEQHVALAQRQARLLGQRVAAFRPGALARRAVAVAGAPSALRPPAARVFARPLVGLGVAGLP